MSSLLAIDTSGESCSCAFRRGESLAVRIARAPRDHTRLLLPMIEALLEEHGTTFAGLDAIAFGAGPGSFTGVRIAASMAQGLGLAASIPCIPVSSLAALAQKAFAEHGARRVLACTDARMGEVYHGRFELDDLTGVVRAIAPEAVSPPAVAAAVDVSGFSGAGSGFTAHAQALERVTGQLEGVYPALRADAGEIAVLGAVGLREGQGVAAEQAAPHYVRDRVARTRAERAGKG